MTNALDRLNHLADRWTPRIVVSVISAAFVLSYAALLSLAVTAGYHPLLAWLWPLVLDGVVIAASLSLLKRQSRGDSTLYAWFLLIAFDGASIWLNANFAGDWTNAIIHGLPPLTLVLLLKLYTADIKTEARHVATAKTIKDLTSAAGERRRELDALAGKIADLAAKRDKLTDDIRQLHADKKQAIRRTSGVVSPLSGAPLATANAARDDKIAARRRQVLDLVKQGADKGGIARELGVSTRTISRDIKSLNGAALEVTG